VVTQVFPSGSSCWILARRSVPIVAGARRPGGRLRTRRAIDGISHMLAALFSRGTKTRSAEQIHARVEGKTWVTT